MVLLNALLKKLKFKYFGNLPSIMIKIIQMVAKSKKEDKGCVGYFNKGIVKNGFIVVAETESNDPKEL